MQFMITFQALVMFVLLFAPGSAAASPQTSLPGSCQQSIVVLTDAPRATKGLLYLFERDSSQNWIAVDKEISVVLGRNGLGWGRGLHRIPDQTDLPLKKEGDGRSPAGIFRLSAVFGYASPRQMPSLKMPYIHITEFSECIDDTHSKYYNRIIARDSIAEADTVDWHSSEKMRSAGIYYELGVVVDHNTDPVTESAGSCIFLHNWSDPDETMAGCTGMSPPVMRKIALWLDSTRQPVFIQLTQKLYHELITDWALPDITAGQSF